MSRAKGIWPFLFTSFVCKGWVGGLKSPKICLYSYWIPPNSLLKKEVYTYDNTTLVHYHLTIKEIKFSLLVKFYKDGRKWIFKNWADLNGSLLKWYFPSQIVLSRGVENFSKCNLTFFPRVLRLWKMAAEVLFEVEAEGRDLEMVRGCHFLNRETQGKKSNYTRKYF